MISHEDDFDKANLVLTIDVQRALQSLFDYIIYLGIAVIKIIFDKFPLYLFVFVSQVKSYPISFNPIVFIPIQE